MMDLSAEVPLTGLARLRGASDTGDSLTLVGGGGALIRLRNISGGSLSEAVQINYAVIKGVNA